MDLIFWENVVTSSYFGNALSTLMGGAVVFLSSVIMYRHTKNVDTENHRKVMSAAFRAEISSLLEICEHRKFEHELEIRYGDNPSIDVDNSSKVFVMRAEAGYFSVYENNLSSIGYLRPNEAEEVVKFYTYAKSFLEDIDPKNAQEDAEKEDWVKRGKIQLALYKTAYGIGKNIIHTMLK